MKKKKNNKFLIAGIIGLFIMAIIIFGTLQTTFLLPAETKNVTFDDITAISQSAKFGSVQASDDLGSETNFCGGNTNEGIVITNNIEGGESLIASSLVSVQEGRNCEGNIQEIRIKMPAGNLSGVCKITNSINNNGQSFASCKVGDVINIQSRVYGGAVPCPPRGGCTLTNEKEFNIGTDEDIEVSIILNSGAGNFASGKSEITLDFVPAYVPEEIEPPVEIVKECVDNVGCIKICGDKTPTCSNNMCECEEEMPRDKDIDGVTDAIVKDKMLGITIFQIVLVSLIILVVAIIVILLRRRK